MTKVELQHRLQAENVPERYYSLDGGLPYDRLCLECSDFGWAVYYSERGGKFDLVRFASEEEACECFYRRIQDMLHYL